MVFSNERGLETLRVNKPWLDKSWLLPHLSYIQSKYKYYRRQTEKQRKLSCTFWFFLSALKIIVFFKMSVRVSGVVVLWNLIFFYLQIMYGFIVTGNEELFVWNHVRIAWKRIKLQSSVAVVVVMWFIWWMSWYRLFYQRLTTLVFESNNIQVKSLLLSFACFLGFQRGPVCNQLP